MQHLLYHTPDFCFHILLIECNNIITQYFSFMLLLVSLNIMYFFVCFLHHCKSELFDLFYIQLTGPISARRTFACFPPIHSVGDAMICILYPRKPIFHASICSWFVEDITATFWSRFSCNVQPGAAPVV